MNQRVDLVRNSLPSSNELFLETIEDTEDGIVFRARTKRVPCCPACLQCRVSYHSHYVRRMRDLPWQGRRVEIHLNTRRFWCRNKECGRKIFAEQLPAVATPIARETARLCEILGIVGHASCAIRREFCGVA
jgi:transposase